MFIDLTLRVTPKMASDAQGNEKKTFTGHLGTHFDVMNKEFPLEYVRREGIVFDIRNIRDREIETDDVNLGLVHENMFVAFCSGFIETEIYGTQKYFKEHPQLSDQLIDRLLDSRISMIGIDFAGVRRGKEHTPKDQYCADRGVFIIENMCGLERVLEKGSRFTANTYPMNFDGMSGLPCRVVAEVGD